MTSFVLPLATVFSSPQVKYKVESDFNLKCYNFSQYVLRLENLKSQKTKILLQLSHLKLILNYFSSDWLVLRLELLVEVVYKYSLGYGWIKSGCARSCQVRLGQVKERNINLGYEKSHSVKKCCHRVVSSPQDTSTGSHVATSTHCSRPAIQ